MTSLAVLILFFNKAALTRRCIESVVKAGLPVYVMDNGSQAEAARAVREFCAALPNVTFLQSGENLGPAGGRNRLIEASREDWLLFLDNDATLQTENWAQRLQAHIAAAPEAEAFALQIVNSWDGGTVRPARLVLEDGQAVFQTVRDGHSNLFPGGAVLVSRRVFDRLGPYDAGLWAFEEAELALRAMRQDRPIAVRMIEDVTLHHYHEFLEADSDREAVRVRYDTGRIGQAAKAIEQRYGIAFGRGHARWARGQARDHLVPPWRRRIERRLWKLLSRMKRTALRQETCR